MTRPAEHEVYAAAHEAMTVVQRIAGPDSHIRDMIDSQSFVDAPIMTRVAHLARAGLHHLLIERPARQSELREVADAIRGDAPRWADPFRQVGPPPREPARCDNCHHRLGLTDGAVAA